MKCKCPVVGKRGHDKYFIYPCGQCLNCRINDTRAWYVRSHFEVKKPERPFQYFLTLTYAPEYLPEDGICKKEHLKAFLNNLNTSFGLRMRYYAVSDYGSIDGRAHYHAIILSTKKITSKQVERIWKKGFIYLKPCNSHRIKYTLRYTVKKKPFDSNEPGYFRLISKGWGDNVVDFYTGQDYFLIDGKKYGISPYLSKKLGLDKKPVSLYHGHRDLYLRGYSDEQRDKGEFFQYINSLKELNVYKRRLK